MSLLVATCRWLAATPVSQWIQTHQWMVPAIQTVHILCIAVVFPAMTFLALRLLGVGARSQSISAMSRRLLPPAWWALVGLAISGALLIVTEPERELPNPAFQAKMAMLLAAVLLTRWMSSRWLIVKPTSPADPRDVAPAEVRAAAGLSLLLWIGIVIAGRWIAYVVES